MALRGSSADARFVNKDGIAVHAFYRDHSHSLVVILVDGSVQLDTALNEFARFAWDDDYKSFQTFDSGANAWRNVSWVPDRDPFQMSPKEIRDYMLEVWWSHMRAKAVLGA